MTKLFVTIWVSTILPSLGIMVGMAAFSSMDAMGKAGSGKGKLGGAFGKKRKLGFGLGGDAELAETLWSDSPGFSISHERFTFREWVESATYLPAGSLQLFRSGFVSPFFKMSRKKPAQITCKKDLFYELRFNVIRYLVVVVAISVPVNLLTGWGFVETFYWAVITSTCVGYGVRLSASCSALRVAVTRTPLTPPV